MKSMLQPQCTSRINLSLKSCGGGFGGLVAASLMIVAHSVEAQITDDFSDGDDTANPAWTHISGTANSTGQTWDASGLNYRLQAPNNGFSGFGLVGSYTGPVLGHVRVEADFVSFGGPGTNPVFGVTARLNGNNGFTALNGYAYVYEPFAAGLSGEMVLYRIDTGGVGTDIGSQQVSLDPAKDYRFVLEILDSNLHGQVFEIGGGMVAERFATDATYATGFSGVYGFGRAGVTGPTDFTIDNFTIIPEPGIGLLMGLGLVGLVASRRLWQKRS